jgi:hypothetical protein
MTMAMMIMKIITIIVVVMQVIIGETGTVSK